MRKLALTLTLSILLSTPVYAEQQLKLPQSQPTQAWFWLDPDHNGIAECYYYDTNGNILLGTTTPDGYTVDSTGAWTINGEIQTKVINYTPSAPGNQLQIPQTIEIGEAVQDNRSN